jgi:transcriptional regulator with XRE-family HTH domain
VRKWGELRAMKASPERLAELDGESEQMLLEMDLKELRIAAGRTQKELAEALEQAQGEISRLEQRKDFHLSTLRRYVKALGGELEITANFGNRRVRLRAG